MLKRTDIASRPASALHHPIRIAWGDCDPAQIVYTARFPWSALDAINAWWEANLDGDGWFQLELDRKVGIPFVRLEMDFHSPVTPRHLLECYVWPEAVGTPSVTFRVDGFQDGVLSFSTRTVSVFIIAGAFQKQKPPEEIRAVLEQKLGS